MREDRRRNLCSRSTLVAVVELRSAICTFTARHLYCTNRTANGVSRDMVLRQYVGERRRRPTLVSQCHSVLRFTRKCKEEEEEDQTLSSYREVK